jgi:hypothetical protein
MEGKKLTARRNMMNNSDIISPPLLYSYYLKNKHATRRSMMINPDIIPPPLLHSFYLKNKHEVVLQYKY